MRRAWAAPLATMLLGCGTWSYVPYTESTGGWQVRALSSEAALVRFMQKDPPSQLEFWGTLTGAIWPFIVADLSGSWERDSAEMALLRAAQLSLDNGYRYFAVDPVWSSAQRLVIRVFAENPAPRLKSYDAAAEQERLLAIYDSEEIPAVAMASERTRLDSCLATTEIGTRSP